jgi:transcription elongation factor Elf1
MAQQASRGPYTLKDTARLGGSACGICGVQNVIETNTLHLDISTYVQKISCCKYKTTN